MKVVVNKCPWTGQLFECDNKFKDHLKEIRSEQRRIRAKARIDANYEEWIAPLYGLMTTDEITQWLNENFMGVVAHFGPKEFRRKIDRPTDEDRVEFVIEPMRFEPHCSTTHCAPKGKKTTGWSNTHIPEPGYQGKIILYPKGKAYLKRFSDTAFLKKIGIHTGSGGGGEHRLRYDLTLFTEDFQGLGKLSKFSRIRQELGELEVDSNNCEIEKPNYSRW